uniref:Uncharacterized protein n=1 Tax=Oryza sativa subsp. japonica TaxID=39947 RepID=Q6YWZ8_ORYSJ|nr:hypothetical protein [Oryza sativa Japonica Group]BAC99882.1 hypothetical protein [Oryza sativa Japonica Group]
MWEKRKGEIGEVEKPSAPAASRPSALSRPLLPTPARSNAEPLDPVVAAPELQPHAPAARRHTAPAAATGDASRRRASAPVVC